MKLGIPAAINVLKIIVAMPFISGICTRGPRKLLLIERNLTFLLPLITGIWCPLIPELDRSASR
jgi:hypothetical protein